MAVPIKLSLINVEDRSLEGVTLRFPGHEDLIVPELDAAVEIGRLMSALVPPGRGVIDQALTIEVRKMSVPTLSLVDLPGIVAASIEGEPVDMMSRTRSISERYLRNSNTIVVVVVPANITRVRDSQAIQLVQVCGKEGVALGVLAKADLAHDPRYKQRKQKSPYWELKNRLSGKADDMVEFPNGWVAVKNRDTLVEEEETRGLHESAQAEHAWFANEACISEAHACGLHVLLQKIDRLFTNHIKSTWVPAALAHLETEMLQIDQQIATLGVAPSELVLDDVIAAVLREFLGDQNRQSIDSAVCSLSEHMVAVAEAAAGLPNGLQHPVDACPTLQSVMAKDALQNAVIAQLDDVVPMCISACNSVLLNVFSPRPAPFPDPLLMHRFQNLRDAMAEAMGSILLSLGNKFVVAASAAVDSHFAPYAPHSAYQVFRKKLAHIIAEVSFRFLLMPLLTNAAELSNATKSGTKRDVASSVRSDDGMKAGQPDLLVETYANERFYLLNRKCDIFIALNEAKKI